MPIMSLVVYHIARKNIHYGEQILGKRFVTVSLVDAVYLILLAMKMN